MGGVCGVLFTSSPTGVGVPPRRTTSPSQHIFLLPHSLLSFFCSRLIFKGGPIKASGAVLKKPPESNKMYPPTDGLSS